MISNATFTFLWDETVLVLHGIADQTPTALYELL